MTVLYIVGGALSNSIIFGAYTIIPEYNQIIDPTTKIIKKELIEKAVDRFLL